MKQALIFISLLISLSVGAETIQRGVVQEYNEKARKTPLSGVELLVRSANSTVSGKGGEFALSFLTLKPGEKVNVRRIEKLGYEIFNKEAIDQWNINPKVPFVIVMCRSDRFKRIRDNYQRKASENYASQYNSEMSALKKLKKEGKLKEAEYQRKLAELMESYDRQLDNLDNYVDRFARIDLSELSAVEQEIIELVQLGQFDEAIKKYDEQNYLNKYVELIDDNEKIDSSIRQLTELQRSNRESIDSLRNLMTTTGVNLLKLGGGHDNIEKIRAIYSTIIENEKDNIACILDGAEFFYDNEYYDEAYDMYGRAKKVIEAKGDEGYARLAFVNSRLGKILFEQRKSEDAKSAFCDAVACWLKEYARDDSEKTPDSIDSSSSDSKLEYICEFATSVLNEYNEKIPSAVQSQIHECYKNIEDMFYTIHNDEEYGSQLARMCLAVSNSEDVPECLRKYHETPYGYVDSVGTDVSLAYSADFLEYLKERYGEKSKKYADGLVEMAYFDDDSSVKLSQAAEVYNGLLGDSHPTTLRCLIRVFNSYAGNEDYQKAYDLAMEIIQKSKTLYSSDTPFYLTNSFGFNVGYCCLELGKNSEAIKYFEQYLILLQKDDGTAEIMLANPYYYLGRAQLNNGDKESAKANFEKAISILESWQDAYDYSDLLNEVKEYLKLTSD